MAGLHTGGRHGEEAGVAFTVDPLTALMYSDGQTQKAATVSPTVAALIVSDDQIVKRVSGLGGPGDDLLSRVLRRSTIGAEAFNGRVRNGIGFGHPAMITRSAKTRT